MITYTREIHEIEDGVVITGVRDFNTDHIFDCGQCFRWEKTASGSYRGIASGKTAEIWEEGGTVTIKGCGIREYKEFWHDYLDMGTDYGEIKKIISKDDRVMEQACEYGSGIRLLRQDPWEALISFIISQNSNIPRIKRCIKWLCDMYGEKTESGELPAFPAFEVLSGLSEEDLEGGRFGYRDKYIIRASAEIAADGGKALYGMRECDAKTAEKYLRSLHGVGPKVANCVLLFGLQKYGSFPLDVWMKRIMSRLYGFKENDLKGMSAYAAEHYGMYSGFAQQYLFYYARDNLSG